MQALILAAGRGSRLGKKGTGRPKCLLEIGRRPLIDQQLEMLADAGVSPVALVVGYCADEVREVVGVRAEYLENQRWSTTNSIYSFWLAREWVHGPVVVLNSDTVIHPEILDRLLDTNGDAIAYDSGSGNAREHMKVKVEGGRLLDMSKALAPEETAGENVGVLKLTAETARALFDEAGELISTGHEKEWLGAAVRRVARVRTLSAVDIAGLAWGEVDSAFDLERVRKEVLPAIERTAWRRRKPWRIARWGIGALGLLGLAVLLWAAWLKPPPPAWESIPTRGAESTTIAAGAREQAWVVLTGNRVAEATVLGPGEARVQSRIIMSEDVAASPYVLELRLDGQLAGWYAKTGQLSGTWTHPTWKIARLHRTRVEVPSGEHTLRVRLVAALDSSRCLIRVRQLALEVDE